ncbi:hypothetical protein V6N12_009127 [Hibiscus sabdariffa]|uniref:Uncharacterized protein n=1 Tax=Hibiscus sabdariffa TaxID=183260 RepID=A0ABR2C6M7_9ROSI
MPPHEDYNLFATEYQSKSQFLLRIRPKRRERRKKDGWMDGWMKRGRREGDGWQPILRPVLANRSTERKPIHEYSYSILGRST